MNGGSIMKVKNLLLGTALAATAMLTTSCRTVTVSHPTQVTKKVSGPPAHAPAYGYRHKLSSNVEVAFDSDSGVYVVVGWDKYFWLAGQYYRFRTGHWEVSRTIDKGWTYIEQEKLPDGLRKQYSAAYQSNNHPGRGLALGK